jgi:L-ascorbate metabolism protein UlaG (beta-lactamase superfamily)
MQTKIEFLKNDNLKTILPEWRGNPFSNNEFLYTDAPFRPLLKDLLRWQSSRNPQYLEKKQDTWQPKVLTDTKILDSKEDFMVRLGHASFLIQLKGVRILTDPVLGSALGLRRIPRQPFTYKQLGRIDILLLSHDHRDHCDGQNLRELFQYQKPLILTTLKMSSLLKSWLPNANIQEAAWFQQYQLPYSDLTITLLPSQHWCRRGLLDFNRRLWGSFMIESKGKTVYFGSDSAVGKHFSQIGSLFPQIDWAILGIGAYKPDYMMQKVHTNPQEAFDSFLQLGAKRMLPMHYGTFNLSDEPISEPYREIQRAFSAANKMENLCLAAIGEQILI